MNGRMRVFRLALAAVVAFAPAASHAQESEKDSSLTLSDVTEDLGSLFSWFDRQLEKGAAASRSPDKPQPPAEPPEAKPAEPQPTAKPAAPKPAVPKPAQAEPEEKPESGAGNLFSWIDEQLEKGAAASRNPDKLQAAPAPPPSAPEPAPAEKPAVQAEVKPAPPPDFVPPQEPIVLTDRPDAAKGKGAARGLLVAPLKP